ncbi:hypothetical protein [Achromobacter sp. Marseille-Q4962]|uniref:hypothetical protein n=1 Tax=Achromobacter sp. Marseille-Q4962 TaxID=2942202 RepID=UPI00207413D6|nr:hypothetical protein [Achromobacter sp. Marseille-Q4962]
MLWRFSANHSHLYPGALLSCLEPRGEARLSPGDEVLVAFTDGMAAMGTLAAVTPHSAVLSMPAYLTQRGTWVSERVWGLAPSGEPGLVRVRKRLSRA